MGEHSARRQRPPRPTNPHGGTPQWLFVTVTLTVLSAWVTSLVLGFTTDIQVPASVNAAVPLMLAFVYGSKAISDHRRDNDQGGDDDA